MNNDSDDPIVSILPIHLTTRLSPNIHIHQYPLRNRPLQPPPSAVAAGKRITARVKPTSRRVEVHVPSDTRPGFWNPERAHDMGVAQIRDDREKNQEIANKDASSSSSEPRLEQVRMRSEQVPIKGAYMLGIVRGGQLHLHPISETHQLRPTLTYLDAASNKKRKGANEEESDEDDGPPLDPDEPAAPATKTTSPKKEKKLDLGETREVQVAARKTDTEPTGRGGVGGGGNGPQGLSTVRREMLHTLRTEEEEEWQEFQFCSEEVSHFILFCALHQTAD